MNRVLSFFSVIALSLALGACASSGPAAISKIKITRVDPNLRLRGVDQAISFEQRHHLHGALTAEELRQKSGNYYTVFWHVEGSEPVTVRFDYQQSATGPKVLTQEVTVTPRGQETTQFAVTGDQYFQQGGAKNSVLCFRAQVRRGNQVLAESKSLTWKD